MFRFEKEDLIKGTVSYYLKFEYRYAPELQRLKFILKEIHDRNGYTPFNDTEIYEMSKEVLKKLNETEFAKKWLIHH